MDKDTAELIRQLCTKAGMVMEDCSAFALSLQPRTSSDLIGDLDELTVAVGRMAALIGAARAMAHE